MLNDRYDNPVSTNAIKARDHYIDATDRLLSGDAKIEQTFNAAIDEDPAFAMAYCGLARARQVMGDAKGARAAMTQALANANGLSTRETAHLNAMDLLTGGKIPAAYAAIRAHLMQFPRDVILAQTCTSVFGLIGFSGQPGREAETLAYTESLLPHYGDDWWFLCQHAFSLVETGQVKPATEMIEKSLALNPRNAHGAHVRAHIYYEAGDVADGAAYLDAWMPDFDQSAMLHCHLSWHQALWALERGDTDRMWEVVRNSVMPGTTKSPPLNVLSDTASILYRAQVAGVTVPAERWKEISDYAQQFFPKTGLAFADVHTALAHAFAGNNDALQSIIANPKGPAGDVVHGLAQAFGALADEQWAQASELLTGAMSDHARIGGSRAQRDLIEFALLTTLLKQGETTQARRLLALRRPVHLESCPVQGMA